MYVRCSGGKDLNFPCRRENHENRREDGGEKGSDAESEPHAFQGVQNDDADDWQERCYDRDNELRGLL